LSLIDPSGFNECTPDTNTGLTPSISECDQGSSDEDSDDEDSDWGSDPCVNLLGQSYGEAACNYITSQMGMGSARAGAEAEAHDPQRGGQNSNGSSTPPAPPGSGAPPLVPSDPMPQDSTNAWSASGFAPGQDSELTRQARDWACSIGVVCNSDFPVWDDALAAGDGIVQIQWYRFGPRPMIRNNPWSWESVLANTKLWTQYFRGFQRTLSRSEIKKPANDVPTWARGNRPYNYERPVDFAKRLLNEKYGPNNGQPKGPGSEFNRIKKWAERHFRPDDQFLNGFPGGISGIPSGIEVPDEYWDSEACYQDQVCT
jgi:hypothetical protein